MKISLIAAAALSLVSAVSFSATAPRASINTTGIDYVFEGDTLVPLLTAPLTKTRAEVKAELLASQRRMDYVFMGDTWVPRDLFMSGRSRDEVRAEARRMLAAMGNYESRH